MSKLASRRGKSRVSRSNDIPRLPTYSDESQDWLCRDARVSGPLLKLLGHRFAGRRATPSKGDVYALYLVYCMCGLGMQEIAKTLRVSMASISTWFRRYRLKARLRHEWRGGRPRQITLKNPRAFAKINSPETAYFAGFLFADAKIRSKRRDENGTVTRRAQGLEVTLAEKDVYLLRRLRKFLGSAARVVRSFRRASIQANILHPTVSLTVWSTELARDCERLGITPNRTSASVPFPVVPNQYKRDFVRGFFDGDGGITRSRKMKDGLTGWSAVVVGSLQSLSYVRDYVSSLGLKSPTIAKARSIWALRLTGPWALIFLSHLYRPGDMGLPRKAVLATAIRRAVESAYPNGLLSALVKSGNSVKLRSRLPPETRKKSRRAHRLAARAVAEWEGKSAAM